MSTFDPTETPTVLVVEDEVLIREDAIDVLEREGFLTLRAGTVSEALALLERRADIRAVFTDIQMPGDADGVDLARLVAEHWPDVVVLVTSGRSYGAPSDLPAASRFIPKPYMPRTVARILWEMIDAGPGWEPGFGGFAGSSNAPSPR